jgi:hypothetical protein
LSHKLKVLLYSSLLFPIFLGAEEAKSENFSVRPSITLEENYDSNVFSRGEDQNVRDDFITTLRPQIEIFREPPGFRLSALYRLLAKYYSKETELNEVNHQARLDMDIELSLNTSMSFGDSLFFTSEILEATETGIQTRRTDTFSNTAFITMDHRLTQRTFAGVTLRNRIVEYSGSEFTDTRTDSASLKGGYELTPSTSVNSTYTYENFFFDTRDNGEHTETHSISLGLDEKLSPTLSLYLSGGVEYTPADTSGDSNVDWIADARIKKSAERVSLSLRYSRR